MTGCYVGKDNVYDSKFCSYVLFNRQEVAGCIGHQ